MFEVLPPAMAKLPQRTFGELRGCEKLEPGTGLQVTDPPVPDNQQPLQVVIINVDCPVNVPMTKVRGGGGPLRD